MGRRRKYTKSYVISIRISDEELQDLNQLMTTMQIKRVSDLMRQALVIMKDNAAPSYACTLNGSPLYTLQNFA